MMHDAIIVGGGLAGLCCARQLQQKGLSFVILEATDEIGGRLRTDIVDGFRLDRGFQVLLSSYPEAKECLHFESLQLRPFLPGALIRHGGKFHTLADPWRRPLSSIPSLLNPIGSLSDKLRVARLRSHVLRNSVEDRPSDSETPTLEWLQDFGFSPSMIDRFFRPFLGGIFLEPELQTSSRMFHFVFRMFSLGYACLPAEGMGAIPRQLASSLTPSSIRLQARVDRVQPGSVDLASGERLTARSVVLATDGAVAAKLLGGSISPAAQGVTCIYFAAKSSPVEQPILVLNGERVGLINNLCVPTQVAPTYGPGDAQLVSVTVTGTPEDSPSMMANVRDQLKAWFGTKANDWHHLRTYRIPYALPRQVPPALVPTERPVRWQPGLYVCGDHRDNASIQGAMVSGRRAAEAILEDLS